MSTRTTLLLDGPSRRAAKKLAAKLDVSPSEVVRRALVHYGEHVLGVASDRRRKRQEALARLAVLFDGNDPEAEIASRKEEDEHF
jgi:hypothetical protein